jgi:hypothetical protein
MVRDRGWAGALLQWEWRGLQLNAEQNPELVALVRQLRRRQPKAASGRLGRFPQSLQGEAISMSAEMRSLRLRLHQCLHVKRQPNQHV